MVLVRRFIEIGAEKRGENGPFVLHARGLHEDILHGIREPQPHRLYGVLAPAKAMAEVPALERIPRHLQIRPSQAE